MSVRQTRIIGLAGWSGAGKTTLLCRLIPHLRAGGLRVSTIKHAHHAFDIDTPGKDSYEHRAAGATEVLVASGRRWALLHELRDQPEPDLIQLLQHMSPVDLILIEGFKRDAHIKMEVRRAANGKPWLYPDDPNIGAIVSDTACPADLPQAHIDNIEAVANLVVQLAWPMDKALRHLEAARQRA